MGEEIENGPFTPCDHAMPRLHGVCIFCLRDQLGTMKAERDKAVKWARQCTMERDAAMERIACTTRRMRGEKCGSCRECFLERLRDALNDLNKKPDRQSRQEQREESNELCRIPETV